MLLAHRRKSSVYIFLMIFFIALTVSCKSTAGMQEDFRRITKEVLPTIVMIDVVEVLKGEDLAEQNGQPFFDYFFEGEEDPEREFRQESLGSGIIVEQKGMVFYVLTNAHVIAEATVIEVTLDDGREFEAHVVGKDERKDLALIAFEVNDTTIPVAKLGDSDELQVGDLVLAMGAPYGYQSTITSGIVSALHRRGGPSGNINDFIQTDASINKGNSGGALVNLDGQVVGVNTWITSQTGGSVGLGFSIPINNAKQAIRDFIEVGHIRYGWLGVSISSVDQQIATDLALNQNKGALVSSVYGASPASKAGLIPGDVLTMIGNRFVNGADDVIQFIAEAKVGVELPVTIIRRGVTSNLKVLIEERTDDDGLALQSSTLWPGMTAYPLEDDLRKELKIDEAIKGVIIRQIVNQSPAQQSGFKTRDIVTAIGGKEVSSLSVFFSLINSLDGESAVVSIVREGQDLELVLERN